jgi:hypothetical protein
MEKLHIVSSIASITAFFIMIIEKSYENINIDKIATYIAGAIAFIGIIFLFVSIMLKLYKCAKDKNSLLFFGIILILSAGVFFLFMVLVHGLYILLTSTTW